MYGLPENLDLSIFINAILLQVCIGANEVILKFDGNITITIESVIKIHDEKSNEITLENAPDTAAHIVDFLSNKIIEAIKIDDGTLRLKFQNDMFIDIYDTFDDYESYQIQHDAYIYIV